MTDFTIRDGDVVDQAKLWAFLAHNHERVTGEPYTEHLRRVAEIVAEHGGDPAARATAWLHAILEGTPIRLHQVLEAFGKHIARDVYALTDPPEIRGLGAEWRHARLVALAPTLSPTAILVKLADIYDNAQTMASAKPEYFEAWRDAKYEIIFRLHRVKDHDQIRRLTLTALGTMEAK